MTKENRYNRIHLQIKRTIQRWTINYNNPETNLGWINCTKSLSTKVNDIPKKALPHSSILVRIRKMRQCFIEVPISNTGLRNKRESLPHTDGDSKLMAKLTLKKVLCKQHCRNSWNKTPWLNFFAVLEEAFILGNTAFYDIRRRKQTDFAIKVGIFDYF